MMRPHHKLPRWLVLGTWLLSTIAVIGTALAPAPPPPDWLHWAVLVLAAAVLGWFATASSLVIPVVPHPPWNMRWRPLVLPAAVVSVTVAATLGAVWITDLRRGCEPPVSVAVVTTPDLAGTVFALTQRFQSDRTEDGCPIAALNVTAADSDQIRSALEATWPNDGGFRKLGARPALVIDDKPAAEAAYRAHVAANPPPASAAGVSVVAHSPLVLAVPGEPPAVGTATWRETVDELSSRGYPVLRPEPSSSAVAAVALALDYPGDGGSPGDPARDDQARDDQARDDQARDDRTHESRYSAAFETAAVAVRADLPATVRQALCRNAAAVAPPRLALVMPEFMVADNDEARRLAARTAGCSQQQWPRFGRVRTTDRASLRLTLARLHWKEQGGCDSARCPDTIADQFATWLDTDSTGGGALVDQGWQLNDDSSPSAADARNVAETRYHAARTRARVVIAVDSSLSMRTHRSAVLDTVRALLNQLSGQDRVRLCTFVRRPGNTDPRTCLDADLGRATDDRKEKIITSLTGIRHTYGNAALADVLQRSLKELDRAQPVERNTIVVITDVGGLNTAQAWPDVLGTAKENRTEIMALLPDGTVPVGLDQATRDRVRTATLDPGVVGEIAGTLWRNAA